MRRIVALLLCLLTVSCPAAQVTLVTWNMQWFPGTKPTSTPSLRVLQMSGAKDALMKMSPDVFCAQEMRNWESFEELVSSVPTLHPLVVSAHRDDRSGGALSIQQIAIASKFPSLGSWSEVFAPASPETPPRGFAFSAIDVEGSILLVYSVHLKSNLGNRAENVAKREESARQILRHIEKMTADYPNVVASVVCGDFNTCPYDQEFEGEVTFATFLEAGFRWPWLGLPKEARITHPGDGEYPPATFDHFLVRGDVRIVSCRPLEIDSVSDHRPVELVLEW